MRWVDVFAVEDTVELTFPRIEQVFGAGVRRIVEGETKLSKVAKAPDAQDKKDPDKKAKDLQQLFLAMTQDVRIVLVKLADRLHNMRTLYGMPPAKQKKVCLETLQVRLCYCVSRVNVDYRTGCGHGRLLRWEPAMYIAVYLSIYIKDG